MSRSLNRAGRVSMACMVGVVIACAAASARAGETVAPYAWMQGEPDPFTGDRAYGAPQPFRGFQHASWNGYGAGYSATYGIDHVNPVAKYGPGRVRYTPRFHGGAQYQVNHYYGGGYYDAYPGVYVATDDYYRPYDAYDRAALARRYARAYGYQKPFYYNPNLAHVVITYMGTGETIHFEVPDTHPTLTVVGDPDEHPMYGGITIQQRRVKEAFNRLSEGDAGPAAGRFAEAATSDMEDGLPKIGYAIATAMLNDETSAVWMIRRVVRVDANDLIYFVADDALRRHIDELIREYVRPSGNKWFEPDRRFMVAALLVLQKRFDKALRAVNAAIDAGDDDATTLRLRDMIEAELRADEALTEETKQEPESKQ